MTEVRSDNPSIEQLILMAQRIRGQVVQMSHTAKAPHLGSSLSCVDILTTLYGAVMNVNAENIASPTRDRFILSKGHAAAALYATLSQHNFFPADLIATYNKAGGCLPEQPSPGCVPGIEAATGSLGHGLPLGLGMAMAARIHKQEYRVFVVLSDGECNEGTVWEAAMFAPAHKLENVIVIVDFNHWQATGRSTEIMAIDPLVDKWKAFGWESYEIDGHNIAQLLEVIANFSRGNGKPKAIIAHTIKGKGVSFMQDDNNWHYRIPNAEEVIAAHKELGLL